MNQQMPVTLIAWRPIQRSSLRGFAKIKLGKSLTINDVAIHTSNGRSWAQMPSKPQLQGDTVLKDDKGKAKYVPILEWSDRDASDRFSEAVIAAVEAQNPGATA